MDLQNITQKNQRSSCFYSTNGTRRITLAKDPVITYGIGQQDDGIDYEKQYTCMLKIFDLYLKCMSSIFSNYMYKNGNYYLQ